MTPDQLKLIQLLTELGDVPLFNRKKTIVKAITEMDLVLLNLILDEVLSIKMLLKKSFLKS